MIIHSIIVKNFKKFKDYRLVLKPGLNIIKGPNESGKSTLLSVLLAGFYHDSSVKIDGYRSWNSGEKPYIKIDFSYNEQRLFLVKDFNAQSMELGYSDGSKKEDSSRKIKKLIAGYLGFESDKAYLYTSCIRQGEIDSISDENIPFKMEDILLGGSGNIDIRSIKNRLNDKIKEIKTQKDITDHKIKELEKPAERLKALRLEQDRVFKELEKTNESYKIKKELCSRNEAWKKHKDRNDVLIREFNEIHKKIREATILQDKLRKANNELEQNILNKIANVEELKWKIKRYSGKKNWYWHVLTFITFGVFYIIQKIILKKLLDYTGCYSVNDFNSRYELYVNAKNDIKVLEVRLDETNLFELRDKETDLARKIAVNNEGMPSGAVPDGITMEDALRLEKETDMLEKRINELSRRHEEFSGRIKEIIERLGEEVEIDEKVEELKERSKALIMRQQVLSLTKTIMETSREQVLISSINDFNSGIARQLDLFTNSKYNRIKTEIGSEKLQFKIYSNEKNEWADVSELSTGTKDQLYLSVRITLLKLVSGEKRPLVIMDDPFSSFDARRFENAVKIMKGISDEYQTIIFTCTNSYDAYSENIVELENENQTISVS